MTKLTTEQIQKFYKNFHSQYNKKISQSNYLLENYLKINIQSKK